ncbi:DUF2950 domain-containing protein [Bordetella sp. LUAb4]|uniref:DUF2950 domain-containing protein n=1 Tax=Bordetella sp. LUAb4 TaxID=2843195 RepID=UPI001E52FFC3|nr:DUF2950 domain-containing protein [Bordetella sp. LUAb4]
MKILASSMTRHAVAVLAKLAMAAILAFATTASASTSTNADTKASVSASGEAKAKANAQISFDSPSSAMAAFGDAIEKNSETSLRSLFGEDFRKLIPPLGTQDREAFITAWTQSHSIKPMDAGHAYIAVGNADWTFPIPLVESSGGWHFDTYAGAEEMRLRRIGRNELAVIQTMLAVYDAQREYAQTPHDGNSLLVYASKLVSSQGKHDGLYWADAPGQPPSPLGQAFVDAIPSNSRDAGFHGYFFKLLKSQGTHAPGGAYDYVVRGKLFGGFAVLAWPVEYGSTGIKSFLVSHNGQVYQADLGLETAAKAHAMKQFDPGPAWTRVPAGDSE